MKFTKELKLAMAKEHVDNHAPLNQLFEKYGIGGQHAKYFIALYKRRGEKAFENKGTKTSYSREQKLKAIKRHLEGGESQYSIALDIGLSEPSVIRDWIYLYKSKGESAIVSTTTRKSYVLQNEREHIKAHTRLVKRNEYLEAENEVLKKWYALILQRSDSSKKKSS